MNQTNDFNPPLTTGPLSGMGPEVFGIGAFRIVLINGEAFAVSVSIK